MKYIMIMVFALGVSACGNTLTGTATGMGKDISKLGTDLTDWANKPSKPKAKKIKKAD